MSIERVDQGNLEDVLPLVAAYQRFYGVEEPDDAQNRKFFAQFSGDSERGSMHLARNDGNALGFVTLYYSFSSVRAAPLAILNDLYVEPSRRGKGTGKELIRHACSVARERGFACLEWATEEKNERAQRLYDALDAERSEWMHYSVDLPNSSL